MTSKTINLPDASSNSIPYAAEYTSSSNTYTMHSVPEVAGAIVSTSNPMPTISIPGNITVIIPVNNVIVNANTPVVVFNSNTLITGCEITNPLSANTNLLIDVANSTPSLTSPTTYEIAPGDTWKAPGRLQNAIYAVSTDANHYFRAVGF